MSFITEVNLSQSFRYPSPPRKTILPPIASIDNFELNGSSQLGNISTSLTQSGIDDMTNEISPISDLNTNSSVNNNNNIKGNTTVQPVFAVNRTRRSSSIPINPRQSFRRFQNAITQIKKQSINANNLSGLIRFKSTNDTPVLQTYVIDMKIVSNYGDTEKVTISEVDVLDKQSHPIEILKVKYDPADRVKNAMPSNILVNSEIIKNENKPEWYMNWTKPGVTISFLLKSVEPPAFLRVWNGRDKNTSNAKDIVVSIGGVVLNHATVARDLGIVVSLVNSYKLMKNMPHSSSSSTPTVNHEYEYENEYENKNNSEYEYENENKTDIEDFYENSSKRNVNNALFDRFGEIPTFVMRRISFQFNKSFDETSEYFALNGIEIYDFSGEIVNLENRRIKKITVEDAELVSPPHIVFRKDRESMDMSDMFIVKKKDLKESKPKMIIEFVELTTVSKIKVWNCNCNEYDVGVQTMTIAAEDKVIWRGKMRRAKGMISGMDELATTIWLTDVPEIRERIIDGVKPLDLTE